MTSQQDPDSLAVGPTELAEAEEPARPPTEAPAPAPPAPPAPAPTGTAQPASGFSGAPPAGWQLGQPPGGAGAPGASPQGFAGYGTTPGGGFGNPGRPPAGFGNYGSPPGGVGGPGPSHGGFGAYGPAPGMPPGYVPFGAGATPLELGVPWEGRDGGYGSRWWATVKAVNGNTREFFAAAALSTGGGVPACTFNMVSQGLFGLAFGLIYLVLFTGLGMAGVFAGLGPSGSLSMAGVGFGIGLVYMIMMAVGQTFGGFVNPWIVGGIHHLLLMLFKGANRNYEHTVRAFAYANGAAITWALIPILGVFPAAVFAIKNMVQAYDETHQCGVGKALLVLFAPVLCVCGCYAGVLTLALTLGVSSVP